MLRNNSDMPKTLKNKMVSGNPRPYSTNDNLIYYSHNDVLNEPNDLIHVTQAIHADYVNA